MIIAASKTAQQVGALVEGPSTGAGSDLEPVPIPPETPIRRFGSGAGSRDDPPGVPVYSNYYPGVLGLLPPGAGIPVADDLTLVGGGCGMVYYDLTVMAVDASGETFAVDVELRTDPCDPGTAIAGSERAFTEIPADGMAYKLGALFDPDPVPIPDTVWMVVVFSSDNAGWLIGGVAEVGSTGDVYMVDHPVLGCVPFDFEGDPWAGFFATIHCGCLEDGDCDDDDPCTIDECVDGVCVHTPMDCDDENDCTTDECVDGVCVHTPVPDGTECDDDDPCTENDECISGQCAGTPIDCDDGVFCNGEETCVDGECVQGTPPCQPWQYCNEETDECEGCGDQADSDCFQTRCGVTVLNLHDWPIPGPVFGADFKPYTGTIMLKGSAAKPYALKWNRAAGACSEDGASLELADLHLMSCTPIAVQKKESAGGGYVFWNVVVTLSVVPPPAGNLAAVKEHANGGTFTAEVHVQPRFAFSKTGAPGFPPSRFDAGVAGRPPILVKTVGPAHWVSALYEEEDGGVTAQPCGAGFIPAVREDPETQVQCCERILMSGPGLHLELLAPDCSPFFCESGACCLPDEEETCDDTLDESACLAAGGEYEADWVNCDDTDGDGLVDWRETYGPWGLTDECHTGTDPLDEDTDGDGCLDGDEVATGTDPLNPCDPEPPCEPFGEDCQPEGAPGYGTPDVCDIADGLSEDCNFNHVPDECEEGACCAISVSGAETCVTTDDRAQCEALTPPAEWLGPCVECSDQNWGIAYHNGVLIVHTVGPSAGCPDDTRDGGGDRNDCDPADPKYDPWVSLEPDPESPVICHDFGSEASCGPIPPGFFDDAGLSDVFDGHVCLTGVPLGPEFGDFAEADTLIERWGGSLPSNGELFDRCSLPTGETVTETVNIRIIGLSLAGTIRVWYNGHQWFEDWDVAVGLSEVVEQQVGWLEANKTHCNGGYFAAHLPVMPRFTFTQLAPPYEVRVLDLGDPELGCEPILFFMPDLDSNPASWVHDVDPALNAMLDVCSDFHGAIADPEVVVNCDCNGNNIRDKCDIEDCPPEDLSCQDCNANGIPDACDLDPGDPDGNGEVSSDCNTNSIPDECETDCQPNGVPDDCDLDPSDPDGNGEVSNNCNGNDIPDECEPDCQPNGIPDDCDVDPSDPDGNGEVSEDCNANDSPDECEPDCNDNGVPDDCDIAEGTSPDTDGNGIPDECQWPMGACCRPTGCVDLVGRVDCQVGNGKYKGDGSVCTGVCGDLDMDADVDGGDFTILLSTAGRTTADREFDGCADYDGDGVVTLVDYQEWLLCYRDFIGDPHAPPPIPSNVGDMNGDGDVNGRDMQGFTNVAVDQAGAGFIERILADTNGDGLVDVNDVDGFVELLLGVAE